MQTNQNDDIEILFDALRESDVAFSEYEKIWKSLGNFLTDYEHLKGLKRLTQSDIAKSSQTTQSAISRLERMKGKPTYELLRRLSSAVGGELMMTPMADVTLTLPYDLQVRARLIAKQQGKSVREMMQSFVRTGIENFEYSQATTSNFEIKIPSLPSEKIEYRSDNYGSQKNQVAWNNVIAFRYAS